MRFAERLKIQRQNLELSQSEVAEKLQVTRQAVSNWENDKNYPDLEMLVPISDVYQISLDQLLREDVNIMKNTEKKIKKSGLRRGLLIGLVAVVAIVVAGGTWFADQERRYGDHAPLIINGKKSKVMPGKYDIIGVKGHADFGDANLQSGEKIIGTRFHGGNNIEYTPKSAQVKFVPHKAMSIKFNKDKKVVLTNFGRYTVGEDIPTGKYKLIITQPADANLFVQVNQKGYDNRWATKVQRSVPDSTLVGTKLLVKGKPYTKLEPNEFGKHPAMTYVSDVMLAHNGDVIQIENWTLSNEYGKEQKVIPNKAFKITLKKVK